MRWSLPLASALTLCACSHGAAPAPSSPIDRSAGATCASVGGEASARLRGHMGVQAHGPGPAEVLAAMCPLKVDGTTVAVEDVDGGAALVFKTTGDASELRSRIETAMRLHDERARIDECEEVEEGPRSEASYEPTEHGARLVLRAVDPNDAVALRAHAREEADRLAAGRCLLADAGDRSRRSKR